MTARRYVSAFAKSVAMGSIAGGAPVMIITAPLAIMLFIDGFRGHSYGAPWSPLYLAFLPLIISTPIALCASISIGLPVAVICAALRLKSALPLIISGMLVGFCIPLLFLLLTRAPAGYWVSVLGALGGGVTGHTWWVATREPKDR